MADTEQFRVFVTPYGSHSLVECSACGTVGIMESLPTAAAKAHLTDAHGATLQGEV